jgi:uncharacterized damage-inducible protein DinB
MIIHTLKKLFERDLRKLKDEIELYKNEENMWLVDELITNSAGNLCLHLIGNLKAYVGVGLAKTSYTRDRKREFSAKNIPRSALIDQIEETIEIIDKGLDNLDESQLNEDFPIIVLGGPTEMEFTLIHFSTHLNYHLGQINYHRRLLDN